MDRPESSTRYRTQETVNALKSISNQTDADGDGNGTDHHGDGKLHTTDDAAAQKAAEEPFQGLCGKRVGQGAQLSADKIQQEDPDIPQHHYLDCLEEFSKVEA